MTYLDYAEDQAKRRRPRHHGGMGRQAGRLPVLQRARRADPCRTAADGRGAEARRRTLRGLRRERRATEALAADTDDIAQLEEIEKAAKKGRKKGGEDD